MTAIENDTTFLRTSRVQVAGALPQHLAAGCALTQHRADEAELLALCAEHQAIAARYHAAETRALDGWGFVLPEGDISSARELAEAIASMPATTPAGLRAKAQALLFYVNYDEDGAPLHSDPVAMLGLSLAGDLTQGVRS